MLDRKIEWIKHQDASPNTPTVWVCIVSLICIHISYPACAAYQISYTFAVDGCCYGYCATAAYHEGEFFGDCLGQRLHQLHCQLHFSLNILCFFLNLSRSHIYCPIFAQKTIFSVSLNLCLSFDLTL